MLKRAARRKAFLKLGISAPSGAGKTLGALLLSYGMLKRKYPTLSDQEIWDKIAIVDTENGSGELYVGYQTGTLTIGEYLAVGLKAPFTADKYISAIDVCEKNNVEIIILDSISHLWAGEGGLLEKQNMLTVKSKSGNSYTAWREVTPDHNRFVDKMLQCNAHVIATMRAKTDYVQDKDDSGKTSIRKVGLKPIQRDGMEYEFTVFLDIEETHRCTASKDRTGLLDGKIFTITPKIGSDIMDWLETGVSTAPVILADTRTLKEVKADVIEIITNNPEKKEEYREIFSQYSPDGNPNSLSLEDLKKSLEQMKQK
jgi:hypothetical protein